MNSTRTLRALVAAVVAAFALLGAARPSFAQPSPEAPAVAPPTAAEPAAVAPPTGTAGGMAQAAAPAAQNPSADPGYQSPMREQCSVEIEKDAKWQARLKAGIEHELAKEFHRRETGQMLTNKRHVVWAYAAILVFLVAFVASLFTRQRTLLAEIERLRADVERAARA